MIRNPQKNPCHQQSVIKIFLSYLVHKRTATPKKHNILSGSGKFTELHKHTGVNSSALPVRVCNRGRELAKQFSGT